MTNNQQAEALRQWLKYPTWSVREGLLLLAGIDPRRADCLHFSEDCTELEASADPESLPPVGGVRVGGPTWCRLGSPERIESGPDGSLHIVGPVCAPDDILLILKLMEHWHRTPGHDGVKMATPAQFIAVAERAGLPPTWLEAASLAGLLPHQPEPPASASPAALPGASPAPAAPAAPDSASAPTVAPPEAAPDGKPEAAEARQDRRLLELRSMGADFVPHGDGWRVTRKRGALAALVEREAGRPMGTKDGVRKDLQRAVQRERERNGRLSR